MREMLTGQTTGESFNGNSFLTQVHACECSLKHHALRRHVIVVTVFISVVGSSWHSFLRIYPSGCRGRSGCEERAHIA